MMLLKIIKKYIEFELKVYKIGIGYIYKIASINPYLYTFVSGYDMAVQKIVVKNAEKILDRIG